MVWSWVVSRSVFSLATVYSNTTVIDSTTFPLLWVQVGVLSTSGCHVERGLSGSRHFVPRRTPYERVTGRPLLQGIPNEHGRRHHIYDGGTG